MAELIIMKIINPILKLIGWGKKKSEKRYSIYRVYKQLNISVSSDDFDSVFNQALYEFETTSSTHPDIIKLFKKPSAKEAFRREYYHQTGNDFFTDLDTNLHTDAQFYELRKSPIDLQREIERFLKIFDLKVGLSRSPKEVEASDGIKSINEKLDKLFLNNKNIYIPAQLKEISKLREDNNHNAVLSLLNNLKNNDWHTLTPDLQYSILLNLAVTYIDLAEKKKAAEYLVQLPSFNYKTEEALGYASLGYALLGETEKSIDYAHKAVEVDPNDVNAYLGLLFSKEDTLEVEELDALIPQHLRDNPQIALNIGAFLEEKQEFEKAFEAFQRANQSYSEMDSFKCDILVQLGVNRMHAINNGDNFLFNQIDEDTISKVTYAHDCFDKAWDYLKHTDLRFSRWYVLTNRGVTRKLLGKKEKAEKDFVDSLELKKAYLTYRHLLIMKMDAGENLDELIGEIEKLDLKEDEVQEMAVFKADELFQKGKNNEALQVLLTHFAGITDPSLKMQFGSMITDTYIKMANFGDAEKYAFQLAEEFPEDPVSFYNLSKISYQKTENDKGLEYLKKSATLVTQKTPRFVISLIADQLIRRDELVAAAELLEIAANPNVNSDLTKKLINTYYHSGNHRRAMSMTVHLLTQNPDDPFLIDVASSIYEINEDYPKAIDLVTNYLIRHPDDKFMRVKLSMNYYKKGDFAQGAKELDKIKEYSNIPLQVQFLIAHLYIKNKEYVKGLTIAYDLRSKNYADPTAHSRYIQCATGMEDLGKEVYFPETVIKDCYVVLRDDTGKTYTYILVDYPKAQNEIAVSESLGQALLGKRIEDIITWNGERLQIQSILWKFTYALHDSMDQLYLRFGNTQPIKVFHLKPSEEPRQQFQDIFRMVDSSHEFDKEVEQLYKEGKTTIGTNAMLSGVSPIKYWGKLITSYESGLVSIGTTFEFQIGIQQLGLEKPLVLDIVALLSLFHSNSLCFLDKLKNKKVITKSTLEVLENEISDLKESLGADTLVVRKLGSQYFRHEVTKEEKQKQLSSLSEFYTQMNRVCEVRIPHLSEDFKEKQKRDKLFGQSFNESILITQELDGIFVSDDAFLRNLVFHEWRVNGISTFILAMFLQRKALIHASDAENYLASLIKLNYRNIPSNPKLLFKILSDSSFQIQQPFINACEFISPSFINDLQASKFVVDFLLEVYVSALIISNRTFVTQFILSKLFDGRNKSIVKRYVFALLDTKFYLLPTQKDQILQILRAF